MEQKYLVISEFGLHARPATKLVDLTTKFSNEIFLRIENKSINLKSIIGILSLGIYKGAIISIDVDGNDAENVLKIITKYLKEEGIAIVKQ